MKNIKDFKSYVAEKLIFNEAMADVQYNVNVDKETAYNRLFFNNLLMEDVADNVVNEMISPYYELKKRIDERQFETDPNLLPQRFHDSLFKSKHAEFLTAYSIQELAELKLFKIDGFDVGFALEDGNIVAVHNNSGIKGIGNILMNAILDVGGNRLDHFDGFLTGFYKRHNFKVSENLIFDKQYAPDTWKYLPLDINNPDLSIYAEELRVSEEEFQNANERYNEGMPDVVFRKL